MTSLAEFIIRWRRAIVAAWLILLAAGILLAPRLTNVTAGGGFDLPESESWLASNTLQNEFGQGYGHTVQLLFYRPGGNVYDPDFQEEVEQLVGRMMELPGARESITFYQTRLPNLVSPDGTATYALVTFSGAEEEIQRQIPAIREMAISTAGTEIFVIGGPAFDYDLERSSEADLRIAETYGLPIVAVILVLVFGSLVAAGLPVTLGGISVTMALAALFLLGHWTPISIFVLNLVTMLGLGLGIDYSLFIVSRFREELSRGSGPPESVRTTILTAGRAVIFSGAAVVIGMAMLMIFNIVFMRSLGLGGVLVAAFSVLVAVTLLPAVLIMLGKRINALRVIPASMLEGGGGGFWHRWSRTVMRRPLLFLVGSICLLLILALPVRDIRAGSPGVDDLPADSGSRRGIELLAEKWSPGVVSPVYIVFDTGRAYGAFDERFGQGLAELDRLLEADARVNRVEAYTDISMLPDQALLRDPGRLMGYVSRNPAEAATLSSLVNVEDASSKTILRVIPVEPGSHETRELVRELRSDTLPGIEALSDAGYTVGGSAAEVTDFTDVLVGAFPYLLAAVLLVTYLVLLLLFRSLVLPLKAIFMNILSVSAAYGVLVLVFQDGMGGSLLDIEPQEGILPFVPVILFSILFGLSMDYEVFLLSRIKEEYDATGDNEHAVSVGLEKTGRIITTAALIMIVVFGSFALTRSVVIKEFGVGLAVSIFLDATVVRVILVPATMKLLGDWNWWLPRWLERLLPDLSLRL